MVNNNRPTLDSLAQNPSRGTMMIDLKWIGKLMSNRLRRRGIETWGDLEDTVKDMTPQEVDDLLKNITKNPRKGRCVRTGTAPNGGLIVNNSNSENKMNVAGNKYEVRDYNKLGFNTLVLTLASKLNQANQYKLPNHTARRTYAQAYPPRCGPNGNNSARATPVRATPVRATPVRATPVRATPARATPVRATPVRATPARATPVRATPVRATPARATPVRATPARATPARNNNARNNNARNNNARATTARATTARNNNARNNTARNNNARNNTARNNNARNNTARNNNNNGAPYGGNEAYNYVSAAVVENIINGNGVVEISERNIGIRSPYALRSTTKIRNNGTARPRRTRQNFTPKK